MQRWLGPDVPAIPAAAPGAVRCPTEVVLPKGVSEVGDGWFARAGVRRVSVPRSVRKLGAGAFYECKRLRNMTFARGSKLEEVGASCFCKSGLEEFRAPARLRKIGSTAFACCHELMDV